MVGDAALVHIQDPAGRPRGTGFAADHHGTVLTSHETVHGLSRLLLRTAAGRGCAVTADAVTALPHLDLALVHTEGLGLDPLPVTVREGAEPGRYVRIAAGCWREARVLDTAAATYPVGDRRHRLDAVLELAMGTAARDALRPGGGATGGPVVDATTGAVIGVLGTALRSGPRETGFAVPLPGPATGPLAELLARNAATVPAYGADLNLAGVLELTATSLGCDGAADPGAVPPVERADTAAEFTAFTEGATAGPAVVLGLVGPPGSGRTTELAALAARRARGARPAPTLWLRGADLRDGDTSVADAVRRALHRAARVLAASPGPAPAPGDLAPERVAHLARAVGRPLLLLLDGPEEMPPLLAHRLADWSDSTVGWLRETGTRMVVACRGEYWEGAEFPAGVVFGGGCGDRAGDALRGSSGGRVPACVRLGDLSGAEAREARARYGLSERDLDPRDARHPLTLRLASEVRAALPDTPDGARPDRYEVFSAHLDLMCLRIAVRLAAENGLRGTAVRRLAAKVAGQVHEAARRSLGPGQGELDRAAFEAVFPWGPAPARLGGGTGWASAVLTEGLLVPAGDGYRFAHEELADWLQGTHLDLDEALRALVHRPSGPLGAHPLPVPHHRVGPVVQALLLLARPPHGGPDRLAARLTELVRALEADPDSWWAARLLTGTLLGLADVTPYTDVLWLLADVIGERGRPAGEFGADFWTGLALPAADRWALLGRLVVTDGPPHEPGPRYLDAAARLLDADPTAVQPHLIRWFHDERPLPATPHATVATAAQALLHTHRHRAVDDLTEALVEGAHRRADELLATLAEEEPSAVCRAVDRWAHDERPARRVAAVVHGLRAAPHARAEADRELLRYAALALLARPTDASLHGGALALLVRDPLTRARFLPRALAHFAAGDPQLAPGALVTALDTHPGPVLDALRVRLSSGDPADLGGVLAALVPGAESRAVALVREAVGVRPEIAGEVAAYVDRRLDDGPAAGVFPLVSGLLDGGGPESVRCALAGVLVAPGAVGVAGSWPLRRELCAYLLAREESPAVLETVLRAAVGYDGAADGEPLRDLVRRTGLLLVRTPQGATRYDRALVELAREDPGFAVRLAGWLAREPREWAAVVGPSARRMIENLAGVRVPA
ncbi:trypsin-like peptidase domain-containing protein [Streptomyces sp. NPDC057877]|uniref:trypsin-like peptidase domain-containing protein n=1 Tax=Streptomyces sp. NPDC057877 TaxID=3346269 RepID=UPI003693D2D7